jgi:hypothetical protein
MDSKMTTPKARSGSNENAKKSCMASHGKEKEPVVCSDTHKYRGSLKSSMCKY